MYASRPIAAARRAAVLLAPLLAACDASPLRWAPSAAGAAIPPVGAPALATLPDDARGRRCDASVRAVAMGPAPSGATPRAAGTVDHAAMGHGATPRAAAADSAGVVAVWWAVRPDSSAWLVSARGRADGGAWEPAVPVDTFDRGLRGCARPAPAIAFEPATRYVHVAYFLDAPEGPGVFYAHSMDGGRLYDPEPEPIVYGERVSRAAVAARRDTVVVAFEDPNTQPAQVTLAFSVTGGHLWVDKTIRVSGTTTSAEAPAVAIDSAGVTVGWLERQGASATPVGRRAAWGGAR